MRTLILTPNERSARERFEKRERIPMNAFQSSLFATSPTEPKPEPAKCEHPPASLFTNRNLFNPRQVDEVCGECNVTLRTYVESGPADRA